VPGGDSPSLSLYPREFNARADLTESGAGGLCAGPQVHHGIAGGRALRPPAHARYQNASEIYSVNPCIHTIKAGCRDPAATHLCHCRQSPWRYALEFAAVFPPKRESCRAARANDHLRRFLYRQVRA